MFETLILNGEVIDGTGAKRVQADVAIKKNRIAAVGDLKSAQAQRVIDAQGKVVTPGFVDVHSHADMTLPAFPTAENLVFQGITTVVTGQCGLSLAPLPPDKRDLFISMLDSQAVPLSWEWSTFGSYLDHLSHLGISVNLVPLVTHGMIRAGVMGLSADKPDLQQIDRMQAEVCQAMEEGAIGVSTGLVYPPGIFAKTDELIEFTRPVGERGGYYFSHIRDEGNALFEALEEAITIGKASGAAVQISHYKAAGRENWWKSGPGLELIDKARLDGLNIMMDMYPYTSGNTSLFMLLPDWAQVGNKAIILDRLADRSSREKMTQDMKNTGFFQIVEWDQVMICTCPSHPEYEGRMIADLSSSVRESPYEWIFDALLETKLDIQMLVFISSEENLPPQLSHPAMMICTDGVALSPNGFRSQGLPHPRNFGAFPRVLGLFVREMGTLTLEEAIWKMSGLPAQMLRWEDRGLVKEGYFADLVVFDPATIRDQGTLDRPCQYPLGIDTVMVNGQIVVQNSKHTGARSGTVLKRS
jgi:N-acyl-D-amino-acid deacylase